jgi:hypothetical protein
LFDAARGIVMGALEMNYTTFKNDKNAKVPKNAPKTFDEVLQDTSGYEKVFAAYFKWAEQKGVENELNFVIEVDKYKNSKPRWSSAATLYNDYLKKGGTWFVKIAVTDSDLVDLVDWIARCCDAEDMLRRQS